MANCDCFLHSPSDKKRIFLLRALVRFLSRDRWGPAQSLIRDQVIVFCVGLDASSQLRFDLLSMGDDWAASRGVAVGATVWTCFLLVGLLTAVIVANCGPIGFVGLMVPHIARALLGLRALPLVLSSALIGAAFLATCDGVARSLSVYELPVGVITNILGAAFFFYLLATRDVSYSAGR